MKRQHASVADVLRQSAARRAEQARTTARALSTGNAGKPGSRGGASRASGVYGACRDVNRYEKLNRIGQGTYGTVYRGRDKVNQKIVALKRVILHNEKNDGFPTTSVREV